MKPTEKDLKTSTLIADEKNVKVYVWNFHTQNEFKAEVKFIDRGIYSNWCAYIHLTPTQIEGLKIDTNEAYPDIDCPHIKGGVTYFEEQEDGGYKVGWDYNHAMDMIKGHPETLESIKKDIEETTAWIVRSLAILMCEVQL